MKPGPLPLELYRGDTSAWQFNLYDDEDRLVPTDLTGVTARAQVRERPAGTLVTDMQCDLTLPNQIVVTITAEQSHALRFTHGAWDLQLTYPDTRVRTIVAGAVFVLGDVTASTEVTP